MLVDLSMATIISKRKLKDKIEKSLHYVNDFFLGYNNRIWLKYIDF